MPYVIVNENDQYCVYKMDANEQPTGESLGCHDTEADAQAQARAIMAEEGGNMERALIGTPGDKGIIRNVAGHLTGNVEMNKLNVVRSKGNRRLAVIFTSNGYKDREDEHVATDALKRYANSCWSDDAAWLGTDNKHLYWHDPALEIGEIIYTDMVDGFLMEVSREKGDAVSRLIWDYMEEVPHGASHGFKVLAREGDTYTVIAKRETSSLPIEAAANVGTLSEVVEVRQMAEKERTSRLDEIFGISGAADILRTGGPAALNAKLAEAGVESKELKDDGAAQAEKPADYSALIAQLVEAMGDLVSVQDSLGERVSAAETSAETAAAETGKAIEKGLKELSDELAAVKAQLSLTPRRASQSPALSGEEKKDIEKAAPVEYDTFFGGLNVRKEGL